MLMIVISIGVTKIPRQRSRCRGLVIHLSRWRDLNPRPLPYQGSALPLSYIGIGIKKSGRRGSNSRPSAWKADALSTELLPQSFVGADGFEPPKVSTSRFTVCPIWPLWNTPIFICRFSFQCPEPLVGFEPTTPRLQITCSGQLS